MNFRLEKYINIWSQRIKYLAIYYLKVSIYKFKLKNYKFGLSKERIAPRSSKQTPGTTIASSRYINTFNIFNWIRILFAILWKIHKNAKNIFILGIIF